MSKQIGNLSPGGLWKNFAKISRIPRASKKEVRISAYIKEFGERLGLPSDMDAAGNVVIKKPAAVGYENLKSVTLQAHLDMVPQKVPESPHNFETDPIRPIVRDGWVTADGTTLGADNGIGVAAILAVLESDSIAHGPLEALFTVAEEIGLIGAAALQPGWIESDILLNLDGSDTESVCYGCAGGRSTTALFPYRREKTPKGFCGYRLHVGGLTGGHSGFDIHLSRGNSIKILIRMLRNILMEYDVRISDIQGGSVANAIPREATAVLAIPESSENAVTERLGRLAEIIKEEYQAVDLDLNTVLHQVEPPDALIEKELSRRFIRATFACHNGLVAMFPGLPGVVGTSTNLAAIETKPEQIEILTLQRSAVNSSKDEICAMIRDLFEMSGAKVSHNQDYPGWKPNEKSEILNIVTSLYKTKFGKAPKTLLTHGGLECGIIGDIYKGMDMITLGPNIVGMHSPNERVSISSVAKFWGLLKGVLAAIPNR